MVAEIWSKKKPATVAVVHWPESTDRQRMGLGEDTRVSNGEGQIETAGRGAGVSQGSRADLGHVGIHRIPISRVLLISPAGDAEVPAIALMTMGMQEIQRCVISCIVLWRPCSLGPEIFERSLCSRTARALDFAPA
jgi:hypothetical protein